MSSAIAIIPLEKEAYVSQSEFDAEWQSSWSEAMDELNFEESSGLLTFGCGDYFIAVMPIDSPIPSDNTEGPASTSWLWPDASRDLAGHAGHLIVTVMDQSENGLVEQHKILTQAVASVVATCAGALGVSWGKAGFLVPAKLFGEMARELLPDAIPFMLWVDFRVGPVDNDSGLSWGFTDGLEDLGLMEMATDNATEGPGELRERLMSIADYLITNGPVIENGHTVGEDADEKITARFAKSPFGHEAEVMMLDYSTKKKKRSWFGR